MIGSYFVREMTMTYLLSTDEFNTVLSQDAEQRYHHFLQQAVTHGEIWILKDSEGCVSLATDDEDCIPVWPHPDYAKAWEAVSYPIVSLMLFH